MGALSGDEAQRCDDIGDLIQEREREALHRQRRAAQCQRSADCTRGFGHLGPCNKGKL